MKQRIQKFDEFINEGIDINVAANIIAFAYLVVLPHAVSIYGEPAWENIKNFFKKRKEDKLINNLITKFKNDPEVQELMNTPEHDRGIYWKNRVKALNYKLSRKETEHLKSIAAGEQILENNKNISFKDISKIVYVESEQTGFFYRFMVYDKHNKQINQIRSMTDFNEMFNTDVDARKSYDFEYWAKTNLPKHIKIEYYEIDLS